MVLDVSHAVGLVRGRWWYSGLLAGLTVLLRLHVSVLQKYFVINGMIRTQAMQFRFRRKLKVDFHFGDLPGLTRRFGSLEILC